MTYCIQRIPLAAYICLTHEAAQESSSWQKYSDGGELQFEHCIEAMQSACDSHSLPLVSGVIRICLSLQKSSASCPTE